MGAERHPHPPPANLHVWMVALSLGKKGNARRQPKGITESVEAELAVNPKVAVALPERDLQRPTGRILLAQRWSALFARFAMTASEFDHGASLNYGDSMTQGSSLE